MTKEEVIKTYIELFTRGEMLKGQNFINNCVPLELEDDEDILKLRHECNARMDELIGWNINGRPYPGTHSNAKFDDFPKFLLAKERITEKCPVPGSVLDVGCYTGIFIQEMEAAGYKCSGIDIHKGLGHKFGNAEDIPYDDRSFDIVTAFDVLEHVFNIDKAILEIERVCKPGGLIVINLPRMEEDYKDEAFEHLRMFSDNQIQKLWGDKDNYAFEICYDEFGRETSFITYTK